MGILNYATMKPSVVAAGATKPITNTSPVSTETQKQMAANSAAWKTATPQMQTQLHQANLDLAKQTGQSYNAVQGTYSAPVAANPVSGDALAKIIAAANTTASKSPTAPVYTPLTGSVDTATMNKALQSLPTFTPPTSTGLNFDQAKGQVSGQIDPMFQRALEALQAQKYQDQLNGDQLGMARGGSHSGLAADLQNKVAIAASGKASDLDATRQTQIAQMAQDLVNRGQDNDFRNKQQALAEYLGLNQLDLQRTGQIADYTGQYGGQQTLAAQNQGFNQGMANKQFDYGVGRDTVLDNRYNQQFDYTKGVDTRNFNYQKAQDSLKNGQWDKSFELEVKKFAEGNKLDWAKMSLETKQVLGQLAISQQNANTNAFQASNSAANQANDNKLQREKFDWEKSQSTQNPALTKELDGLYTGITSGQITGSAAIDEINNKVKVGLIKPADAAQMLTLVTSVTSSQPNVRPGLTQQQIDANGGNNPQDLNSAQLDKLWYTDPSGKAAGRPSIDWAEWYTDPRGKVGGISYEAWKQAYGPQLKAR